MSDPQKDLEFMRSLLDQMKGNNKKNSSYGLPQKPLNEAVAPHGSYYDPHDAYDDMIDQGQSPHQAIYGDESEEGYPPQPQPKPSLAQQIFRKNQQQDPYAEPEQDPGMGHPDEVRHPHTPHHNDLRAQVSHILQGLAGVKAQISKFEAGLNQILTNLQRGSP